MNFKLRRRLSMRLAARTIIIGLLLGLVLSSVQIGLDLTDERRQIDQTVSQIMESVREQAAQAAYHLDRSLAQKVIHGLFQFRIIARVKIVDDFDTVLGRRERVLNTGLYNWATTIFFGARLNYTRALYAPGGNTAVGKIEVVVDNYVLAHDFFKRAGLILISDICRNLILAGLLSVLFFSYIARPLIDIAHRLSKVDPASPAKRRLEIPSRHERDELGLLTSCLNQLLENFDHSLRRRRKAEARLQEREEKYRLLVNNAMDAIFVLQNETVAFSNPRTEEITGFSTDELSRRHFSEMVDPRDQAAFKDRYSHCLDGHTPTGQHIFRMINKSGEELWVQLIAVPTTWNRQPAAINFLRDITPQKKLEFQLQQSQKMEAIGTLAGGIAHDFNNLLMGIQGRSSMMLMELSADHPHYRHVVGIEEMVRGAADLTKQLLGFARGGKYEVKTTDLNQLVTKNADMFGRTRKELEIHLNLAADLRGVDVDRSQLEQVLLNLSVNAWQAMPEGGRLSFQTSNVVLDSQQVKPWNISPGPYIRLSVTDTGAGMDEITRQKIFEPFFTTKKMGRGTGLGLATVYGIVKNHFGFIDVYSEISTGSTFTVYLPASVRSILPDTMMTEEISPGSGTILLVDDEDSILDVGTQMLEKMGYRILSADGGEKALKVYADNAGCIDMVILDMIMSGLSGAATYKQLRSLDPDIKVLLSSGYSLNGRAQEILKQGCNGFIQKPFNMSGLSQSVKAILDPA